MRRLVSALALIAVFGTAGCAQAAGEPAARPVTTSESELLAISRFTSFDLGSRPFRTTLVERGVELRLQGWVDYANGLGYAATTGDFPSQALYWTHSEVGIIAREPDVVGDPLLPMPSRDDAALVVSPMDPTSSQLDAVLAIISSLGADRPDNPLLLVQSGALWLREDDVEGTAVTVFAAPPSDEPRTESSPPLDADSSALRLWVREDGLLLRAQARIGSAWVDIDFADAAAPELQMDGWIPE
ncbi:hypothetical protein [Salinibacterium sp. ZJ77]|uniref:hypothetical protein n=1 Tax=Salinibacterium sp. ZJ77 TaxID=2708337 RepID=UPI00142198D2|nr:hypothetical protein [Salinibacterium sp. ZJ77]